MGTPAIVSEAWEVFRADATATPPLTLRGANAVDGYDLPSPFDATADAATDAYLEGFAFWGLPYLDARSWRHYLPRLIDYACRHPDDRAMVLEALVRSLRPPDRYPPRLATLDAGQEDVVRRFLEHVALGDTHPAAQAEALQALEEWWLPGARSRPTAAALAALRAAPVAARLVIGDVYRLSVPETLAGSGRREIPEEARRVETFGGYLCGDAHTVVAVNVTPLARPSLPDLLRTRAALVEGAGPPRAVEVRGSKQAERLDGMTQPASPAEPQTFVMLVAAAGDERVTLSIRSWPRPDVDAEVERILGSFEIVRP